MTKIESYHRGASFSVTEFFADIVGRPDDPAVARLLGTYPQVRKRG
jgi:prephenate dehydratase